MMNECKHNFSRERQRVLINVCCKCGAAENIVTIATQQTRLTELEAAIEADQYHINDQEQVIEGLRGQVKDLMDKQQHHKDIALLLIQEQTEPWDSDVWDFIKKVAGND